MKTRNKIEEEGGEAETFSISLVSFGIPTHQG